MRTLVIAAVLLGSSCLYPSFAQNEMKSPSVAQPQTTPVQPESTPQQSEQSRGQERKSAEDVQIGRDWRAQERDRIGQNDERRMGREMDRDDRTVGRNWRMRPDDDRDGRDGRSHYDEDRFYRHHDDRSYRRVKVCTEYENGDEYCHYRD